MDLMLMWLFLLLVVCSPLSDGICTNSKNIADYGYAVWSEEYDANRTIDGNVSTYNTFRMEIYTVNLRNNSQIDVREIQVKSEDGQSRCNITNIKQNFSTGGNSIIVGLRCVVKQFTSPILLKHRGQEISKCDSSNTFAYATDMICRSSIQSSGSWHLTFKSVQLLSQVILDVNGPPVFPLEPSINRKIEVVGTQFPHNVRLRNLPLKVEFEVIQIDKTVVPLYGLPDDVISYFYNHSDITIVAKKQTLAEIADYIRVRVWYHEDFPQPTNTTEWKTITSRLSQIDTMVFQRFDLIVVQVKDKDGNIIEGKDYSSAIICESENRYFGDVCDVVFGFNDKTVKIWFKRKNPQGGDKYRIQAWNFPSGAMVSKIKFSPEGSEFKMDTNENYFSEYDDSFISTFESSISLQSQHFNFYNMGKRYKNAQSKPGPMILKFTISPSPKVESSYGDNRDIVQTTTVLFKQWKALNINRFSFDQLEANHSSYTIYNNSEVKYVKYQCDERYKHVAGNLIRFCAGNGMLIGDKPTCEVADTCSYGNLTANYSSHNISKNSKVKYVEYRCDEGYKHVNGNLIMFCDGNGTWIGNKPTCKVADPCSYDFLVANHSSHTVYNNSKVKYVEYQCDEGYKHVNGNLIMFCDGNGTWIGNTPTCEEIICDEKALHIPDAEYKINGGTSMGDKATFKCKDKYRLVGGDRIRVCRANGTWNGIPLICDATKDKLREMKRELEAELLVVKANVSSFRNSKISVYEDRPTVVVVGMTFGIVMCAFVFALVVIPDIPTLFRHFIFYQIQQKTNEVLNKDKKPKNT